MQKRRLGSTDIDVSILGLGTVKFGRNQGVKYPTAFQLPTDAEIRYLLDHARTLGINLLDTAPAYGTSEARLGKLLGNRTDWIITTKVGEEFSAGISHFDFSPAHIIHSIERSLARLNTDYLDIVLVHSNGDDEAIIENHQVFATLAELKKAGKIRAFGMSTKTEAGGLKTIADADVAMVTFNTEAQADRCVISDAHRQHKGILIKKALASGHISVPIIDSMRFIFNEPGVSSVIVGTLNPTHLSENAKAACLACD